MIPVSHAADVARALPDCRVELFESAGHFPHLEDPARFSVLLREFVSDDAPLSGPDGAEA